jgi:flavin reductase (DIM6/NTAB) family NADH-FMN oxidoreductase RutF
MESTMAKTVTPREFGMPAGFVLFPPYNPRIVGLGVGRKSNAYRLEDRHGQFHYVNLPSLKAAQITLHRLDR